MTDSKAPDPLESVVAAIDRFTAAYRERTDFFRSTTPALQQGGGPPPWMQESIDNLTEGLGLKLPTVRVREK